MSYMIVRYSYSEHREGLLSALHTFALLNWYVYHKGNGDVRSVGHGVRAGREGEEKT